MFVQGQTYRRKHIHDEYGGQRQGGVSTPASHPTIFLFTGDSGLQYGYEDGWQLDGTFLYTGEGQRGDMKYIKGNRAINYHLALGKDLHLFSQGKKGAVRYICQMVCTGSEYRRSRSDA